MTMGKVGVFLCCLIILFIAVEAQGHKCTTPDGALGKCINIYQCKHLLELIKSTQKASPPNLFERLRKYECGRDIHTVKVCCPTENDAGPPDVSTHKNVNLLPTDCGNSNDEDKIVNGLEAGLFEFPWMALLSYKRGNAKPQFLCGGTVINSKYILTAAHCLTPFLIGVRLGEHNILTENDCQEYDDEKICAEPVQDLEIEESIQHPEYNMLLHYNDIALIRVKGNINLKQENINNICLPISTADRLQRLTGVTVTGWGYTNSSIYNGSKSDILMKVVLDYISPDICQIFYTKINVTNKQMCASRLGKDSCGGDSGGPLMGFGTDTNKLRYLQYGIVSFGPVICADPKLPGVYTDVRYYMHWILESIKP